MKEGWQLWQWFFVVITSVTVIALVYGWILSMLPEGRRDSCLDATAETNCNAQSMKYKDRQQEHYHCIDSLKNLQKKYYTRAELEKCNNA